MVCSLLLLGHSAHRDRKASCERPWGGSRSLIPILPGVLLAGSRSWGPEIKAFFFGQFSRQERESRRPVSVSLAVDKSLCPSFPMCQLG